MKAFTVSNFRPLSVCFFHSCSIFRSEIHSFRWPDLFHDIALALAMASIRPQWPADWNFTATTLCTAFSTPLRPVHMKDRECRDCILKIIGRRY